MSTDEQFIYKIGIVGPTRVGKTSLIASILRDTQTLLASTGVSVRPRGTTTAPDEKTTASKLSKHQRELEGSIIAREFNPGALKGNEETFTFELEMHAGDAHLGIRFSFLDYPGGWLDDMTRPPEREKDWAECEQWIKESPVMLIPIDAGVLMQAEETRHKRAIPFILTTDTVANVAREWAIARKERNGEPALLMLCPLKCESYFNDNGGQKNEADLLYDKVVSVYHNLFTAVRGEADHIKIIYCPVDTIGCVEVIRANWKTDKEVPGDFEFTADYRVRHPYQISVKGADTVVISLCKLLVDEKQKAEKKIAETDANEAKILIDIANKDEGFFKNLWLRIIGERRRRKEAVPAGAEKARIAIERVEKLSRIMRDLAEKPKGPRVRMV